MVSQNENDIFGLKYMYEQFRTHKYFSELVYMWEYSTKLIQRITFMAKKSIYRNNESNLSCGKHTFDFPWIFQGLFQAIILENL